jgi:hypothetical protein
MSSGSVTIAWVVLDLYGIMDKELRAIRRSPAGLGKACTPKVADWLEAGGPGQVRSIGKLRSIVRQMLAKELSEIDQWVEPLL